SVGTRGILDSVSATQKMMGSVGTRGILDSVSAAQKMMGSVGTREILDSISAAQKMMEQQIISPMVKSFNNKASIFSYSTGLVVLDDFLEGLENEVKSDSLFPDSESSQEVIAWLNEVIMACIEQIKIVGQALNTLQTNQVMTTIFWLISIASSIITIVVFFQRKPTEIHHHHHHYHQSSNDDTKQTITNSVDENKSIDK
ncbi:hypothetical protein ACIQXF_06580, partial [Lysinibacillus sp. NPDC097231]|uniref:hypothetical protein n=1 Tax=Lysinibacillus sp. NPDC097231 TaxID=3364142 RepID=UPI00382C4842